MEDFIKQLRDNFSTRFEDYSMPKAGIKKRSKVPGVMITQFIEELPEGKSTPDFLSKPIALTIQEGKLAIFKAHVCGDPKLDVTWGRAKGDMSDTEKFQNKYEEATGEYTLEIPRVSGEETDTYKCYATNEYGNAICTAALNVIEVGFKKKKAMEQLEDVGSGRVNKNCIRPCVRPSFVLGNAKLAKPQGESNVYPV
ncbi:immunoglobulin-like and fibronectin type III domain-containing protein 1 [Coregonus clupeaformis]|uniref:immunoglobulin-like and fibronectin type III domain-containing protein 1 n=1 Tax=Coregonus clupeaformis TaxID=59861 RepID=UPI001E1C29EB|nr:immunoglobulin-like and fibronectin type III domain-containing protein 1 [Coregonus clupeaformis]